jgi:hypothetical protein
VVAARPLVAEVAIGGKATLAVVLGANHHVHAAVDGVVHLLAHDEALDCGVAEDRNQQAALAAGIVHGVTEVGQVKERDAEELEERVGGRGVAVGDLDGAGDQLPVWPGQAAVGHGAVDHLVAALAGLEKNPAGEEKRVGCGVDDGTAGAADAKRPGHVVETRGVHVQPHVAVLGLNEHIVGAAGKLQMALGFKLRSGLVIDHLLSAQDVIAVVDHHIAGEGPEIADPGLALGLPLDRHSGRGFGFGLSYGENLLAGVVGKLRN